MTVIAVGAAVVAALSGENLAETRGLDALPAVRTHQERGELLRNILLGFTVVVGLAAWRLGGPSGLKSGRGERRTGGPGTTGGTGTTAVVELVLMGLLVVGAVAVGVAVFLAGRLRLPRGLGAVAQRSRRQPGSRVRARRRRTAPRGGAGTTRPARGRRRRG